MHICTCVEVKQEALVRWGCVESIVQGELESDWTQSYCGNPWKRTPTEYTEHRTGQNTYQMRRIFHFKWFNYYSWLYKNISMLDKETAGGGICLCCVKAPNHPRKKKTFVKPSSHVARKPLLSSSSSMWSYKPLYFQLRWC